MHLVLASWVSGDLPPRISHLTDEKIEAPRGQVTLKVTQQGSGRVSRGWLWLVPRKSPPENSVEKPSPPLPSREEYVYGRGTSPWCKDSASGGGKGC